jgi:hypothetical protein
MNDKVRFDIWNEPNEAIFWNKGWEQYHLMWNTAVQTIRSRFPQAPIVGTSASKYDPLLLQSRLDRFKADGTVPDIWCWHFSADPVADAEHARAMLNKAGYPNVSLSMNEYLYENEQNPGKLAWYLARLQRTEIAWAAHAIWADCCYHGLLDGALTLDAEGNRLTKGEYWVYRTSAAATGKLVYSEGAQDVDLIATRDDDTHQITALLGSRNFKGSATVKLSGLDKIPFPLTAKVHATVKRIVNGITPGLTDEFDTVLSVKKGTVEINLPWKETTDAYVVVLTF